jgi:hypothetical protein
MDLINAQTQVAPVKKQIARGYYRVQFRNSGTDVPERLRVNVGEDVSATCRMGVKRAERSPHAESDMRAIYVTSGESRRDSIVPLSLTQDLPTQPTPTISVSRDIDLTMHQQSFEFTRGSRSHGDTLILVWRRGA